MLINLTLLRLKDKGGLDFDPWTLKSWWILIDDFIACPNRACYYKLRVCVSVFVFVCVSVSHALWISETNESEFWNILEHSTEIFWKVSSQIREVRFTDKFRMFWNDPEHCSVVLWFCGSVVSYSISIPIRVLEYSRTFYRNS